MEGRRRAIELPELFLGLLSIGVAVVLTAHILTGTIHDARHSRDTLSVTASGRVPIDANLVRWSLTISDTAPNGIFNTVAGTAQNGTAGATLTPPPGSEFYLVAGSNSSCGLGPKH